MTIKASDEWKEHALHPDKAVTGESPDTEVPAGRISEVSDAVYGAESADLDINAGNEGRDTHTAGPDVAPRADGPGQTVTATDADSNRRTTGA